ncbi:MAG: alpha/beta hydrolase [Roseovarius sp.]|uniref:alpha/beta fold hydrolase n=1 Tax=Roseovarius sp. TaxID=1486281 RepID=UPI0032EF72B7
MKRLSRAAALPLALVTLAAPARADIATVDGHDIHYEVHGELTPDPVPVLMLHGGMMSFEASYGAMLPALTETHTVIGVEQQGHGHTPLHDGPLTAETMRRDTLGVLDALSVDRVHVVGFSAGGMLALELAVNAPERVASVVAISTASQPSGFMPGMIEMQKDPNYQPSPDVLALMPSEADFADMAAEIAAKNPGGAETVPQTMQKMTAFITSDWGWPDDRIAGIAVPVLVVNGDTDFILPEHALHLFRTIPGAQLAILPDTTHMTILEQPALLPMIEAFLDTPAPAGN